MARYTYEGSSAVVESNWRDITSLVDAVSQQKKLLGINQMIKTFDLFDGTMVYIVDMEHIANVHIVAPSPEEVTPTPKLIQRDYFAHGNGVPEYVCGAVTSPIIDEVIIGYDDEFNPITEEQVRFIKLTDLGEIRTPEDIAKPKLAVHENSYFVSEFEPPGEFTYSQHRNIRPALYTGSMRRLTQVLLGIGIQTQDTYELRQSFEEGGIPVPVTTIEIEHSTALEYMQGIESVLEALDTSELTSAYNLYKIGATPVTVDLYYDWRANRTHGIHIGLKEQFNVETQEMEDVPCAYVVEIGARGVHAWVLGLDPYSTTAKGRAQYEALYPELFDESNGDSFFTHFGGFPSPATPPKSTEAFDRLVRAGEIVQGLDPDGISDFYSKPMFSTGMGWAYNDKGTEAHNTCYGYDDSGLRVGYHYAITLEAKPLAEPIEEPPNAAELIQLLKLTGWQERKAKRLTEEQIVDIIDAEDPEQAFDDAVAQPSFQFVTRLYQQKKGFLYHPARLVPIQCWQNSGQPQWKVWEPVLDFEISFDFGVDDEHKPANPPVCDAPLFVTFNSRGGITVLNYWWKEQEVKPGEWSTTREECQYEGTWVETQPNEGERVAGNFYTNEWDPREVKTGGGTISKTTGTFEGTQVCFHFLDYFGQCCKIDLNYHHSFYTERTITGTDWAIVSTAWPKGDRSAVYVAKYSYKLDHQELTMQSDVEYTGHGAQYSYGRIYEFATHWTGFSCPSEGPGCPPQNYICNMRPICPQYRDYEFSCFPGKPEFPEYKLECENGHLVRGTNQTIYYDRCDGELPQIDPWSEVQPLVNEHEIEVRIFGDNPMHGRRAHHDKVKGEGFDQYDLLMSTWWLKPSPDGCDARAYLHVNTNCFGSDLMGYEPQFDANAKFLGVPVSMHIGLQSCYVGYVSEVAS